MNGSSSHPSSPHPSSPHPSSPPTPTRHTRPPPKHQQDDHFATTSPPLDTMHAPPSANVACTLDLLPTCHRNSLFPVSEPRRHYERNPRNPPNPPAHRQSSSGQADSLAQDGASDHLDALFSRGCHRVPEKMLANAKGSIARWEEERTEAVQTGCQSQCPSVPVSSI